MKTTTTYSLLVQYKAAWQAERSIADVPAALFNARALELIRSAQKVRADIRAAFGVMPDDVEAEVAFERQLGLSMLARG